MDFLKLLGAHIKGRILKGEYKSVEKFALGNGIAKSTLSEVINGKTDPKITTLAKICAGLEITPADLLRNPAIEEWVRESAAGYIAKVSKRDGPRRKKPGR